MLRFRDIGYGVLRIRYIRLSVIIEDQKAEMFEFWKQNLGRVETETARIWAEQGKRKGQWENWSTEQFEAMKPEQYRSMAGRELDRLD